MNGERRIDCVYPELDVKPGVGQYTPDVEACWMKCDSGPILWRREWQFWDAAEIWGCSEKLVEDPTSPLCLIFRSLKALKWSIATQSRRKPHCARNHVPVHLHSFPCSSFSMESYRFQVPLLHRQTQVVGECSTILNLLFTAYPLIPISIPATYTQSALLCTCLSKLAPYYLFSSPPCSLCHWIQNSYQYRALIRQRADTFPICIDADVKVFLETPDLTRWVMGLVLKHWTRIPQWFRFPCKVTVVSASPFYGSRKILYIARNSFFKADSGKVTELYTSASVGMRSVPHTGQYIADIRWL